MRLLPRPSLPPSGFLPDALSKTALHVGLSLVLLTNSMQAPPALAYSALSEEQLIAAEAWKLADREYVNRDFNGQDWFKTRQKMVSKKYGDKEEVRPDTQQSAAV